MILKGKQAIASFMINFMELATSFVHLYVFGKKMQVIAGFVTCLEFVQLSSLGFWEFNFFRSLFCLVFWFFFRQLLELISTNDFASSFFLISNCPQYHLGIQSAAECWN